MKPILYYPVKPLHINQVFGANITYYETNFGQKGHPGIDFEASHGEPVYAAHDGAAIYIKDKYGGEGIWNYANGYITIYWHLIGDTEPKYPPPIPYSTEGVRTPVKAGELIGYADNTGAPFESSGDHLHFGLLLTDSNGIILNQDNGTQGCINPEPYFNGLFAQDINDTPIQIAENQVEEVSQDIQNINPQSPTASQQESLVEQVVEEIINEVKSII